MGGLSRRRRRGAWCSGRPWSCRYHWPRPPFCSAGGAVDLDATAVDEQLGRYAIDPGQVGEDTLPHTALGPSPKPVVEGLLRPVDMLRAVAPAPAALQGMNDPGKHAPVIDPRHPSRITRQMRLDPCPLLIRKPEKIRHAYRLPSGDNESRKSGHGNPINGSGP